MPGTSERRGPGIRAVVALLIAAVAVVVAAPAAAAQAATPGTGQVTIVHGLRGLAVDVYVDGELVLPAFEPDRLTDPVSLPAGEHRVDRRDAGAPVDSDPRFSGTVALAEGDDLAVVAHFGLDGGWTASVYDNRLDALPAGRSQLQFRNTAAVPAVDLVVDDSVAVQALVPAAEQSLEVDPGDYVVQVRIQDAAAVTDDDVTAREGEATILYLVGQPASGNLTWLMQTVGGLQTAPAAVPAGNSGLLADPSDDGLATALVLAVSAAALAAVTLAGGVGLLRRRAG